MSHSSPMMHCWLLFPIKLNVDVKLIRPCLLQPKAREPRRE